MSGRVLIVPGFGGSGPEHWQTRWERADGSMVRIRMEDWNDRSCARWVEAIEAGIGSVGDPVVVVAHSAGCLAFVHWAARYRRRVGGALLVAVPDPDGVNFPAAEGFASVPLGKLPYPSIVVSSCDDPYGDPRYSKACAEAWGSELVDVGMAGHINAASNLGDWAEGMKLLMRLRHPK
jgi:serine hydrolase